MNLEFHYYAVHALALRAGYPVETARTLALASQYVDDAIHPYEVHEGGAVYRTVISQNYVFWDEDTMRDIYLPFHFLPGDPERAARERLGGGEDQAEAFPGDPRPEPVPESRRGAGSSAQAAGSVVTPDSPLAKAVLVAALNSRDPFRIGIALHSYADTWAHQHFSGRLSEDNRVDASSPLPPAGHLQALRSPDEVMERWTDGRLKPEFREIDNRERFLSAAKKIYRYLRASLGRGFEDEGLILSELGEIWRPGSGREERISDFVITYNIEPYDRGFWPREAGLGDETAEEGRSSGYDKLLWLKTELGRRAGLGDSLRRIEGRGRFFDSPLHRWNEAARIHRAEAQARIAALRAAEGAES